MNAGTKSAIAPVPNGPSKASAAAPDVEIRLSPLYAWGLIVFGAIMFFMGLPFFSSQSRGHNVGLGIFICVASIATVVGSNYWRHHLPVMVRMTPRQLFLPGRWPRHVVVNWTDIVEIETKTLTVFRRGIRHTSEFVCIKLKNPIPNTDPMSQASPAYKRLNDALMKGINKAVLGGYDIAINPQDEFARTADWFIGECSKRMAAVSAR
jgi:hypothetical protein